jgi:hypothetical protein
MNECEVLMGVDEHSSRSVIHNLLLKITSPNLATIIAIQVDGVIKYVALQYHASHV